MAFQHSASNEHVSNCSGKKEHIAAVIGYLLTYFLNSLFNFTDLDSSSSGGGPPSAKRARTSEDVRGMSSKEYMDAMVVPTMLKALSAVNKEVGQMRTLL